MIRRETRQIILCVIVASLVSLLCDKAIAQTVTGAQQHSRPLSANVQFDSVVDSFSKSYHSLSISGPTLSYTDNFERLDSKKDLLEQKAVFSKVLKNIRQFNAENLNACQQVEHSIMEVESQFVIERARLGLMHDFKSVISDKGIYHQPNGKAWYAYFLARWNGANLDFDQLFAFGENELARAVAAYDALQSELGYENDDAGLASHLEKSRQFTSDKNTLAWFKSQQDVVWANLPLLFTIKENVVRATIKSSDRGSSFPVPGYYDPPSKTFYFNKFKDRYEARQADWLLLHEATPGHHYQIYNAQLNPHCQQRLPEISYSAYTEGWAAYVETLGDQLGVYQSLEAKLAATEWNMVRSVRVVLDVAINAYGWSDEDALDYWVQHVRGQRDVAEREIARMRRWPAQVVTYKFGAQQFERLRDKMTLSIEDEEQLSARIRDYHDVIVGFRSMPLDTFEKILPKFF